MGDQPRATVFHFPPVSRGAGPEQGSAASGHGVVVRPWRDREVDAPCNQTWDELLRLVDQAWSWRDPETLSEVEACLLRVGIAVETDWS